ncbi:MAG TPA: hypothetical protein VGJ86_02190, partial [Acidimicrobiales bacterium]
MTSLRDREPDRRVQRAETARRNGGPRSEAVPEDLIAEFEHTKEAKQVQRLADARIVDRLRSTEFDDTTSDWKEFATALVEYGYAVLVAWGVTGELGIKVSLHGGLGRGRMPVSLRLGEDDS